ncbi:MAG: DNA-binding protein [Candidatus Heimdallarchaeota archaeon]|nr:MAG: DNA-binding protein [Candidatus Heimdallarchaeota archaeon]
MEKKSISRQGKSGKVFVARIKSGNDLLRALNDLVEEHKIKAGVFLSGVGLLRKAGLRNCKSLPKEYPITDENRSYMEITKPLEILALSGNISEVEGKPWVHAHVTLSYIDGEEIRVVGGHLIEGCIIFGFAEVIFLELKDIDMRKTFDEETQQIQLLTPLK